MNAKTITPAQRYTRGRPCPICGGSDSLRRGKGIRCSGYISADGEYAYCTREEYAGALPINPRTSPPAAAHRLYGPCKCGDTHNPARVTQLPRTKRAPSSRPSSPRTPAPAPVAIYSSTPGAAPSSPPASTPATPDALARAVKDAPVPAPDTVERKHTHTYHYRDAAGALAFQVLRYALVDAATGEIRGKTFRQRRPDPERPGAWVWNLDGLDARPIYRLAELLAAGEADPAAPVYLCEGEKDADALAALGLCATTTAQGAASWRQSEAGAVEALRGRHVVILPDNDAPGAAYAHMAAASLYGLAASVRVLTLAACVEGAELAPHADVSDWLDAGGNAERLAQLAAAAPAWTPSPEPVEDAPAAPSSPSSTRGPAPRRRPSVEDEPGEGEDSDPLVGALHLRDTRYGGLWYAPDAQPTGLYVAPRRGAPYCILSARVDVLRIATHEAAGGEGMGAPAPASSNGRGSVYHLAFTPDLAPDRPLTLAVTRDAALTGALYTDSGLENVCSHTPADKTDLALVWQALASLTSHMGARTPALRSTMARALGWHAGAWVRVNGHIDREGAHVGAGVFAASVPADWPQVIPGAPELLPKQLDAGLIRDLLTFWPREISLYPLAAWGACAYIMRPYTDGRAAWELEVFGPTGAGKTALTNWILRAFYGAGYVHDTATQLTPGRASDTGPGRILMRSRLAHHAYMTYDHNARPKQQSDYEKQQQDRIESADATGNRILGGAKSTRDGRLEMRPQPMGLLIRTGEADPHDYSVPNLKTSSDARCVTFLLDVGLDALASSSARRSRAIAKRAAELDALAIAYTRWLASLAPGEAVEQWAAIRAQAARLVAVVDCEGAAPGRHERAIAQCEDLAAGLASYAAFLRAADLDAGADGWRMIRGGAALADDLDALAPELVRERLAASHDLMARHADAAGGTTARDALASAFLSWLRGKMFDRALYLSGQRSDTPQAAPVSLDRMGWEPNRITGEHLPGMRAGRLGALSDDGRYIILDNQTLDTLASQAARENKAITYSTLQRFKSDLLAAGAIEGYAADPEHRYYRNVRIREWDPVAGKHVEALRWRVHILAARVWPQTYIDNLTAPETTETTETTETGQVGGECEAAIQAEWHADALDVAGADLVSGAYNDPETTPYGCHEPDALDAGAEMGTDLGADALDASTGTTPAPARPWDDMEDGAL